MIMEFCYDNKNRRFCMQPWVLAYYRKDNFEISRIDEIFKSVGI